MKPTAFDREILLTNRSLFQIAVPLVSCLRKGIFGRTEHSIGSEPTTFPHSASAGFCGPQAEKP